MESVKQRGSGTFRTSAVALTVLLALFVAGAPNYWVFLASAGLLMSLAALGLTVIVGWGGEVSLAQAALVGTSVYVTGYGMSAQGKGWPFLLAAAFGVLTAVALSLLVALPTAKLSGIYVMVLTLGLQIAIERTVFSWAWLTGAQEGMTVHRPSLFGLTFESDRGYFVLVLVVVGIVIGLLNLFRHSRHGRALLLVRTDRKAAAAIGVSAWRYKLVAFVLGGSLAGVAGAFTAPLYRSPPALFQYLAVPSLLILAIAVMAGAQSLVAVTLVASAVVMLPQALERVQLSVFVIGGLGLLLATYIGPRGIGGAIVDARTRRRRDAAMAGIPPAPQQTVMSRRVGPFPAAAQRSPGRENGNGNGRAGSERPLTLRRGPVALPTAAPASTAAGLGLRPRPGAVASGNGSEGWR